MNTPQTLRRENLRGMVWMIAAMAAFAIEDAFIKTATRQLAVGQVLVLFGTGGALLFGGLARRSGAGLLSAQATPLIVVLGATAFFGETVGWRRWCAIFAGLIGVMIILRPAAGDFPALSLLAVVGTLGFAGRNLASRAAPASLSTWHLDFYGFMTVVLAGVLFSLWDGKMWVWPTVAQLMGVADAVVAGVLAYTALMRAMRTGSIASVTPLRYTRLLFGITLGNVMFGEQLDGPMILGCLVVIGSGLFIGWQGKVNQK